MSLDLAKAEKVLVRRLAATVVACDLSATPAADTTPREYFADPLAKALRAVGNPGADPIDPADPDFATVPQSDYDALLDCAHLFALESFLGNFCHVDYTSGTDGRKLAQLRDSIIVLADRKRRQIQADHPCVRLGEMPGGAK